MPVAREELSARLEAHFRQGRQALDAAAGALARATASGGRPEPARLEAYQSVAFRLAHLHARSYAARQMIAYAALGALEALLAAAFVARTLDALRRTLPWLGYHLEAARDEAEAFAAHPETAALIREASSDAFNQALLEAM